MPVAAGGQDDGPRPEVTGVDQRTAVDPGDPEADDAAVGRAQRVERDGVLEHLDAAGAQRAGERAGDLRAAGVAAGVHDPVAAVPALAGQRRAAVGAGVEPGAERLQRGDRGRRLLDEGAHGVLVAEPGAGDQRVGDVQVGVVVGTEDGGQAALRPGGAAVTERALGDDGDRAAGVGQRHRRHQAGGAGAHDDDVGRAHPAGRRQRQRRHQAGPRPGHSPTGDGVPRAIIASTAARARAATSGSTVTSSRPSRSARSSFSGVDIFM